MTRNWQEIFQHGGNLEDSVVRYLQQLEADIETWIALSPSFQVDIVGPTDGQVLTYDLSSNIWTNEDSNAGSPPAGNGGTLVDRLSQPGPLTTGTGTLRLLMPAAGTLLKVILAVNTAPAGAAIVCDVNKNGTTVFTTQANRPTVADGAFASSNAVPAVTAFSSGDYLTFDIDQVGSGVAGANLTATIVYKFT